MNEKDIKNKFQIFQEKFWNEVAAGRFDPEQFVQDYFREKQGRIGEPIQTGVLKIPPSYNKRHFILSFNERAECDDSYQYNSQTKKVLNDKKVLHAASAFEAGESYFVYLLPVLKELRLEEAFYILKEQGFIFGGLEGIFLVQRNNPEILSTCNGWVSSFDREELFFEKIDSEHRIMNLTYNVQKRWLLTPLPAKEKIFVKGEHFLVFTKV